MATAQHLPADCLKTCTLSDVGYALIQNFEGYSPFIYEDAAGLPTIGFGHLIKPGEKFQEPLLPEDARKLLEKDVASTVKGVNRMVEVKLRQTQADAVISFTFNLGVGALSKSTLLKRINAGRHDDVPSEMLKWVRAGGVVLQGLITRRKAEAEVYQK